MFDYGFVDWSGDAGFKFALGSSEKMSFCLAVTSDYGALHAGLSQLRREIGLPARYEFHFAHASEHKREAFFDVVARLPWSATMLIVDKELIRKDYHQITAPTFIGAMMAHLISSSPLANLQCKRILVDDQDKQSPTIRSIRISTSPVFRARGVTRVPIFRGEPADKWDGLQLADMLAGALNDHNSGRKNYAGGVENRFALYHYPDVY
ncbi:MAG: hypothetical protein HZB17_14610 [Chloroflexi bacterium]|nr:hypothetical protein [Chloroflexota bacterium]